MIPVQPPHSIRITLQITADKHRLDAVLMEAIREQSSNLELKNISRSKFKELFSNKRIQIKGQNAKPSSTLAIGTTYVDILGFVR